MSRGGHNWKGGGVVEGARSIDVMRLARAGYLREGAQGAWRWSNQDGSTALIQIAGGRQAVTLDYRVRSPGEDWQSVKQIVPIRWTPCRFGGERPWFVCDFTTKGVLCGRTVAKLYGAGRLFACRHCYRLGYAVQRGGPIDIAHHRLARVHRRLGADYGGPHGIPPCRPKWMRHRTYSRLMQQVEAGEDHLDLVFATGAMRIMARIDRAEPNSRRRG
jgi:hypothetical protein